MEHIKFTLNNTDCKNRYNPKTFIELFGKNNKDMKNCECCDNLEYEDGIMSCKKFNMGGDQ